MAELRFPRPSGVAVWRASRVHGRRCSVERFGLDWPGHAARLFGAGTAAAAIGHHWQPRKPRCGPVFGAGFVPFGVADFGKGGNELTSSEEFLAGCVTQAWTSRFRRSLNPVRFRAAGPSTCGWVPDRSSSEARSSIWPRPTLCVPAYGSQRCPTDVLFGVQQAGRYGERA